MSNGYEAKRRRDSQVDDQIDTRATRRSRWTMKTTTGCCSQGGRRVPCHFQTRQIPEDWKENSYRGHFDWFLTSFRPIAQASRQVTANRKYWCLWNRQHIAALVKTWWWKFTIFPRCLFVKDARYLLKRNSNALSKLIWRSVSLKSKKLIDNTDWFMREDMYRTHYVDLYIGR